LTIYIRSKRQAQFHQSEQKKNQNLDVDETKSVQRVGTNFGKSVFSLLMTNLSSAVRDQGISQFSWKRDAYPPPPSYESITGLGVQGWEHYPLYRSEGEYNQDKAEWPTSRYFRIDLNPSVEIGVETFTAVDSPLLHRKLQATWILKKGLEEDMNEAYEAQNEHQHREYADKHEHVNRSMIEALHIDHQPMTFMRVLLLTVDQVMCKRKQLILNWMTVALVHHRFH
jgi:hypothetical protein